MLVALSKTLSVDTFEPNASGRIAADPACNLLLQEVAARCPGADPAEVLTLVLQTLDIEASDPRGQAPRVECVATLQQPLSIPARPTRVVIREMVAASRRSILAAGYLITDGSDLLPLAQEAAARDVRITLVCDRERGDATRIRATWPTNIRAPTLLINADPNLADAKMHAKVLIVDDEHLLVTSANFTWHGQAVNIEYGLRLSGEPARRTALFFKTLKRLGVLTRPA
jgi:phosphatidylserine/phosphatidylglycerophosphate/cardiolipin synthase-like enzyme